MSNPEIQNAEDREPLPGSRTEKGKVLSFGKAKEALVNSDRLQTQFLFAIDKIKNHPQWHSKVIDGFWNKLSAKDRELLYQGGKPGFIKTLKNGMNPLNAPPFNFAPSMKYDDTRLKLFGDKISESARSLVQLDMLPAPEGIAKETLAKDILSDKKNMRHMLTAVQFLVDFFAPEIAGEIGEAKMIGFQLIDLKSDMATKQLEKKAA
jgi:hypothetical protein